MVKYQYGFEYLDKKFSQHQTDDGNDQINKGCKGGSTSEKQPNLNTPPCSVNSNNFGIFISYSYVLFKTFSSRKSEKLFQLRHLKKWNGKP